MVILIVKYFVPERTESPYLFCTKLDAGAVLLCRQPLCTHNSSLHKQAWGLQSSLLRRIALRIVVLSTKSCREMLERFECLVSRVALVIVIKAYL